MGPGPTASPHVSGCTHAGTSSSPSPRLVSPQLVSASAPGYKEQCLYPHFAEDKVKTQRSEVTWAKSNSK